MMVLDSEEQRHNKKYVELVTVADELGVSEATLLTVLNNCQVTAGIVLWFGR